MITKNSVIAFLIFTAGLFSCLLILQNSGDSSARAGQESRAGRYITATADVDESTGLLWIANVDTQVLSVYGVDVNGIIYPFANIDLKSVFTTVIPGQILPNRLIIPQKITPKTTTPPTIKPPTKTDDKIQIKKDDKGNIIKSSDPNIPKIIR